MPAVGTAKEAGNTAGCRIVAYFWRSDEQGRLDISKHCGGLKGPVTDPGGY
jgi:hypothetical protein